MTRPKIAFSFILLLSLSIFSTACGNKRDDPAAPAAISDLVVTLVTRTGATKPAYSAALKANAGSSAIAFRSSLGDDHALNRFAGELPSVLSIFQAQYSAASTSTTKAEAADRLFNGILQAADLAGISGEQLELAMLSAFADLQTKLALPPLSTSFTAADRELVNLLMVATGSQLHRRTVLNEGTAACAALGVDTVLSTHYIQTNSILDASFLNELSSLEAVISDPVVLGDGSALAGQQWNLEAIYDLFLFRYQMELTPPYDPFNPVWATALNRIIGRMDAVGGIMSGMTVSILQSSGVSTNTQPWSLKEFFVYDWVRTGMSLSYDPSTTLAGRVAQLGGTAPSLPNFSYFTNPYLAVFRLKYDFDLASKVDGLEWNQATSIATSLPMNDRYTLRKAQYDRRHQILSRFTGATDAEKAAITAFFASPH